MQFAIATSGSTAYWSVWTTTGQSNLDESRLDGWPRSASHVTRGFSAYRSIHLGEGHPVPP
jgi:hypothetical protein